MKIAFLSFFAAVTTITSAASATNTVLCEIRVVGVSTAMEASACMNQYEIHASSIYSKADQQTQKLGSFASYKEANQAVLSLAGDDICGDMKVDRSRACPQ